MEDIKRKRIQDVYSYQGDDINSGTMTNMTSIGIGVCGSFALEATMVMKSNSGNDALKEAIRKLILTFEDNLDTVVKDIKKNDKTLTDTDIYCILVSKKDRIDYAVKNANPKLEKFDRTAKKIYDKLEKKIKEYENKISLGGKIGEKDNCDINRFSIVGTFIGDMRDNPSKESTLFFEKMATSYPSMSKQTLHFQGQSISSFLLDNVKVKDEYSIKSFIDNVEIIENNSKAQDLVELQVTEDVRWERPKLVMDGDPTIIGKTLSEQNCANDWIIETRTQSNCLGSLLRSIIIISETNVDRKYDLELSQLNTSFINMLSKVKNYAKKLDNTHNKNEIRSINFVLNEEIEDAKKDTYTTIADYIELLLSKELVSKQQSEILKDFKTTFNIGNNKVLDTDLKLYNMDELTYRRNKFVSTNKLDKPVAKPSLDLSKLNLPTKIITDEGYEKRENERIEHIIKTTIQSKSSPNAKVLKNAIDKLLRQNKTEIVKEVVEYSARILFKNNEKDLKKFIEQYENNDIMKSIFIEVGLLNKTLNTSVTTNDVIKMLNNEKNKITINEYDNIVKHVIESETNPNDKLLMRLLFLKKVHEQEDKNIKDKSLHKEYVKMKENEAPYWLVESRKGIFNTGGGLIIAKVNEAIDGLLRGREISAALSPSSKLLKQQRDFTDYSQKRNEIPISHSRHHKEKKSQVVSPQNLKHSSRKLSQVEKLEKQSSKEKAQKQNTPRQRLKGYK